MLENISILVVEDEPFIALYIASEVEGARGTVVGPASSVSQAIELINKSEVDGAVLAHPRCKQLGLGCLWSGLFRFYRVCEGVIGTTCSGTVAFAHTPAFELHSRPDLHNGPFFWSHTSPRPTAVFSGSPAANAFKAPNPKSKSAVRR